MLRSAPRLWRCRYFLEAIIALAPFSKKPFNLTLRGITNEELDPSVDVLRA